MDDFPTREERDLLYGESAALLNRWADGRREHEHSRPNCGAAPMCLGPQQMAALASMAHDGATLVTLLIAAVGEIDRAERATDELKRRLEVQRDLTVQASAALEAAEERARVAEDAEQDLAAELDDKEHQIARMAAELTSWEEAAEVFAPTDPVVDDGS